MYMFKILITNGLNSSFKKFFLVFFWNKTNALIVHFI